MNANQLGLMMTRFLGRGSSGKIKPNASSVLQIANRCGGVAELTASGTYTIPTITDSGQDFFYFWLKNASVGTVNITGAGTVLTGESALVVSDNSGWSMHVFQTSSSGTGLEGIDYSNALSDVTDAGAAVDALFDKVGNIYIPIPLTALRIVSTMAVGNTVANGGVMSSDTTPVFEPINGATAGCQRLRWAASNNTVVMFQMPLPDYLDEARDITLNARIASGGTSNAVGFTVTSYFGETGAAVSDTTGTNQTTAYATVAATIAAADVPSGAKTMTVSLTPVAHTTDTLNLASLELIVPIVVNGQ